MTAVTPLRVPVLMYHEIADIAATPSRLAVSPDVFADQLAYLRDAGFNAITAGALSAILADGAGDLPERPVVLTFDDGYGDFYSQAMPLLKQHGFTGTLFMTTGWIGKEGEKKRMLNWRELAEAEQAGIEIGAHTCKHPQLDQLPENLMREELYVSKSLLEDNLGLKVPGLAYPFGYSSAKVRQVARERRLRLRLRRGQRPDDERGGHVRSPAAHRPAGHHRWTTSARWSTARTR